MRRNRNNHKVNKVGKIHLPIKTLAAIIALVILALYSFGSFQRLKNSDFFKIKEVLFRGNPGVDLSFLKGENLLSLDLDRESAYILGRSSGIKSVRLVRILPDRVLVDFIKRVPAAIVKLYRSFCVDSEGVLFDCSKDEQNAGLVEILGLDRKIFGPKPGKAYNNIKELSLALEVIKEIKGKLPQEGFQITLVDVSSPQDANFVLARQQDKIQVKIGRSYIRDKITILDSLIHQQKDSLGKIKYIDLRFKEPVIKFKDAKQ